MAAILTLREFSALIEEWGLYIIAAALVVGLASALLALLSTSLRIYAINLVVLATVTLGLAALVPYLPGKEEPLSLDAMTVQGVITRSEPAEVRRYFDAGVKGDMAAWSNIWLGGYMSDEQFQALARDYPDEAKRWCGWIPSSMFGAHLNPDTIALSPISAKSSKLYHLVCDQL